MWLIGGGVVWAYDVTDRNVLSLTENVNILVLDCSVNNYWRRHRKATPLGMEITKFSEHGKT